MNNTKKNTILLVEDEMMFAIAETKHLAKYGYSVHHVTTGEEAVKTITDNIYLVDLILMDIELGSGIDGTQAAQQILKHKDIPIVFLSSHTEPEMVERTEKITSYGYVVKHSGIVVHHASIKMALKLFEANRSILENEIKHKAMLDNISDVIVIIDKEGINRYKSPIIEKLFGWKPEELIGKSIWDNVHPDDFKESQHFFAGILKEPRASGTTELRYRCKTGEYKIIEITLMNLLNDTVIQGVLGNYHDISIRKKIEQEERALAALIENSNDIAIVKNLNRRIISANNNFVRTSIFESLSELLGKTDADILGIPEDEEPVHSYMLDDLKALHMEPGESLLREEDIPSADGITRTYMTRKFPVYMDSKVMGIGVITTDITERKQMEIKLKEKVDLISMIMDTSPVGIVTVDKTGNITYANKRAEEILGLVKDKITSTTYDAPLWNHTDLDGSPLPDEKQPFNIVKTTMKTAYNIQHGITWPDGTVVLLSINASPMKDKQSNFNGMVATLEDITEQKKAEVALIVSKEIAEKANRAKSEFLSNISHEIRTPMNGIFGFIDFLLEIERDEEKVEYLNIVKDSSEHLLEIINDILSLSKIEAGKMKVKEDKINLFSKINLMANSFIKQAEYKGLEFKFEMDRRMDKEILADGHSILKILNNLLSNSVKFTKDGYIKLSVKEIEDKKIEILVKDTGIGINEEKQKHLFEAFEQGEYYLTKQYGGTGLGLAIIKRIVDLLNGEIFVDTEIGKGTEFKIIIPYREVKREENIEKGAKNDLLLNQNLKIISAEDVEINQRLLERVLKSDNIIFKKVYNGQELLDELERQKYNLILMDIQMPILNGIEATKIIKTTNKYKDIPIIAISAYAFEENIEKIREAGMNDYISKPVKKEELISKINRWTRMKND